MTLAPAPCLDIDEPDRIERARRTLPSQTRLMELLRYDAHLGALYWLVRPSNRVDMAKPAGTPDPTGYWRIGIDGTRYLRHRIIYCYHYGDPGRLDIDHINGVPGDDRIENLRLATHAQNQRNRRRNINNKSGSRGVHWFDRDRKWRAEITFNGKTIHIGYYDDIEAATTARREAELRLFGQYAGPS